LQAIRDLPAGSTPQENGLSVATPDRAKSATFRVTTVNRYSSAVAAINPSLTGKG
jgi:hypothetical protein